MSADTDSTRPAAADAAAAPLDLLLTDAATGMLRRVNPGGSGLRLAAALAARPRLVTPGGATMLGSPVDLAAVDRDTYLVAGITDHICDAPGTYIYDH